ncbi:unnamed protein product [Rhizopus stolonifer]
MQRPRATITILKFGNISNKETTLSDTPSNSESISEIVESLGEKQARLDLLESRLGEIGLLNKELHDLRLAHSQEIQKMEEAISQLKEECKHYQSKLFEEQQHSRSLEKTIQELSKTSESHSLIMENAQKEYQNLQEKMRKQKCNSQTTLRQRVEELEKFKLDISTLQLVVEKQDAIIQGLEFKLEEMDRLVNSLRIQLDKSNMSVERLQVDNAEKAKIAADMQQQLGTMLKDVCGMGMEKKQLENVMCLMEGTLKLQEEKSEESMSKLEEIKKQYTMREEEIEEKRRTLDLLFVEKQALAQSLQQATYRVSQGDEMMKNLVCDLESTKAKLDEQVKKNGSLEEELVQKDVELQHIQALKDQELDRLEITLKKQLDENEALSKTVVELEATLKTERALASAQDSSGIISELEHKLTDLQKMKKKEDGLWKKQIKQLKEELQSTREENQQKQSTIDFLEASLNEVRRQLSKFLECQKLKEEEENATKTLDKYQSKLEKLKMNEKQNLSVNSVSSDATQEELTQKILQLQDDNVQLVKLNGSLESQLVLQRSQFTLETKNLELELMKLTAANDRLEKEMEQTIPRNNSNHGCLTSHNRESVQFSSPPQTPRVSSPPPSASNSSNTVQYKLQRDVSISSIAKLSKSGSYRSMTNVLSDSMAEDEAKRMSNNSSRSEVGSPRLSSSLRSSRTVIASNTLPPLTAPPSNPLPPVPTPLPPVPFASSSSPLFNTSSPNDPISPLIQPRSPVESAVSLHRQDSSVSTSFSEILNATDSSNFTPEQYDKLVESLQRKVDLAEEDVKAHQDVIIKLEEQLNLSELSVKEIRKQFDTLNREKQACDIEIQNLRAQITQIQSEQKSLSDESIEDRKQLEQELEDVKKKKDAAEKARKILEDRMHVLMNRKSKFMCF